MRRIVTFIFTVFTLYTSAQEIQQSEAQATPLLRISVGGGYLVGGQFFSEAFTYNPAFSGELALYHPLSSTVNVGLGTGASMLMRQERFIPVFLSFVGFMKPDQASNYLLINVGTSAAWRSTSAEFSDYKFKGGMMFKAGFGRRFLVGNHSILAGVALHHQWAKGTFANGFGLEYNENLNFDWLAFELRFFY